MATLTQSLSYFDLGQNNSSPGGKNNSTLLGKNSLGNAVSNYNKQNIQLQGSNFSFSDNGVYQFPSGVSNTTTSSFSSSSVMQTNAYMMIPFYKYIRPIVTQNPTLSAQGTIVFPIPNELTDRQSLDYSFDHSNPIIEQAIGAAAAKGQNFANYGVEAIKSALAQGASNVQNAIQKIVPGPTANKDIGLQLMGYAQNPYLTVLFKSPMFKRFMFSWLFIPQSKTESDMLNFILNKLRYHALPNFQGGTTGNVLYTYPDMCVPMLFPTGYQFDFKHCVIDDIRIDYVPGTTPAYHASSKAPVGIRLTLSLLEIELWSKQDFNNDILLTNPL